MPRLTLSASVKTPRRIKLNGTDLENERISLVVVSYQKQIFMLLITFDGSMEKFFSEKLAFQIVIDRYGYFYSTDNDMLILTDTDTDIT